MNSSFLEICVAPSSINILPKNRCSNRTRCWCSVCSSYSTFSTSKVMRNPRSSNSVSAIQRFLAEWFVGWFFGLVMANPRGKSRAMVVIFRNEGKPKIQIETKVESNSALQVRIKVRSDLLAAEDFIDVDALGGEGLAQHRDTSIRLGAAAHENVECRVTRFWPCMDRDVALRQHRDSGHAARLKMMQVNVQEC